MKVLYITNMYPSATHMYNGIHVKEQIDHLSSKFGIDYELYFIDGINSRFNYIKSVYEINRLLMKGHFDLVHIHFGLAGMFMLFNPLIRIPKMVTIHGSDIGSSKGLGLMKAITRAVSRRCDVTVILNDNMFKMFKRSKNLVKIPCGIDLDFFNLDRSNDNGYFTIGFPGDINRGVKNYSFFKKVVDDVASKGFKVKTVIFHDLTRPQVAEALRKLDCLLMTSYREGSPQMVKEAMAAGIPVISTNVGDVSYLLENVRLCHVINSFDVSEFSAKIVDLINLKPEYRVTSGRERIKNINLDQESVCSKIYSLYTHLLPSKNVLQLK